MKSLGLDFGTKKIGVAIVDSDIRIASPLMILKNDEAFLTALKRLISEEYIDEIVVGMPGGTGFEISDYLKEVETFVIKLADFLPIPIKTFDESYTTAEAQRLMKESRTRGEDDDLAAMVMLQAYSDSPQIQD